MCPSDNFQKIAPSVSLWTDVEEWSAGGGLSEAAAEPSPFPLSPWQGVQFDWYKSLPILMDDASLGKGLFFMIADWGAFQSETWAIAFKDAIIRIVQKRIFFRKALDIIVKVLKIG